MSNRPDILLRVGAAFDRSFDAVLADASKKYERAFGTGRGNSGNNGRLNASERAQLAIAQRIYDTESKLNRQIHAEQAKKELELAKLRMRLESSVSRERQREARAQDSHIKAHYQNMAREHQRAESAKRAESRKTAAEIARAERAERQSAYRRDREIDRLATRTSHRATRFFFPPPEGAIGYAKRTALDVVRGAGVDLSLGGGVARAKEREEAGVGLAQQERIANGGVTRGAAFWSGKSLEVGTALGVDPAKVTELMRAFTGKTGDFDAAVSKAKELAAMTLASGANMGEMGSAAGFVYNQLKGMPDAAERTLDVMRGIVGQTAVGAVEMEEYAKQMGRIAANAKMFQGDVSQNILELSALTQLSIAEGGATSGADAARSIAAFANTTSKGQRIKAFNEHGVSLFNEAGTQKRPILDIIKDSLIASKGNIPAMTKMWADTLGQKPIRGLTNAFNAAGGGEAGWQAALEKIKPFMAAQLDPSTQRRNVEDYQNSTSGRVQRFQNALDRVTERISGRLLSTLERAEPAMLQFVDALGNVVTWAAENPGKAILAAMTASIARAGLESVGRLILDRVMASFAGSVIGNGVGGAVGAAGGISGIGGGSGAGAILSGGGAVGGVIGTLGVIAGMAALGAATYSATTALLELVDASNQKSKQERTQSMNEIYFGAANKIASADNPLARQQAVSEAMAAIAAKEGNQNPGSWSEEARNTLRALNEYAETRNTRGDRGGEARSELAGMGYQLAPGQGMSADDLGRALAGALTGKTMEVRVRNVDEFNFTPADPDNHFSSPSRWFQ